MRNNNNETKTEFRCKDFQGMDYRPTANQTIPRNGKSGNQIDESYY